MTAAQNGKDCSTKDPELQVKVKCVLNILDVGVEKFNISVLMPQIIDNWKAVCHRLKDTEYENCAKLLKEFVTILGSDTQWLLSKSPTDCAQFQNVSRLIDAFQEHYKVVDLIGDMLHVSDDDLYPMAMMKLLRETAQGHMNKDARSELLLDQILHETYHQNKFTKRDIEHFQKRTIRSKNALRWRIASKEGTVAALVRQLKGERQKTDTILYEEEKLENRKLRLIQMEHQQREKLATDAVERDAESLGKTLKSNLKNEHEMRAERNKLLIQLETLMKRYDVVMAEKFKTKFNLDQEWKELQADFNDFMKNEFEVAEKTYRDKMGAIERQQKREFEQKLALFVKNRAAKIIQKHWKRYIKIVREERGEDVPAKPKGKAKKK